MSMKFLKSAGSFWKKVSGNVLLKDSDANVGIGRDDPVEKLTVYEDNDTAYVDSTPSTWGQGRFENNNTDRDTSGGVRLRSDTFDAGLVAIGTGSNAGRFAITVDVTGEALTIDSATGAVTKPNQPAFLAYKSSDQAAIAVNSDVTVTFGTEVFDQGGDFASNTFTAPVTGRYQLSYQIRLNVIDSAAPYYVGKIITSNREYRWILDPSEFAGDINYLCFSVPALADMDASDTAYCTVYQSGGTEQTVCEGQASLYTYFSGYLAC